MAESIVNLVVEKVTYALANEVLNLWGVKKKVEKVRRELDWIRAFLKDADTKQIQDEMQKQWVREVTEVAYWIEDIIDTFICEFPPKRPGKRAAIKRMFAKAKKLPLFYKLGNEMNQIRERLEHIRNLKNSFGINSLGEGSGQRKMLPVKPPVLPDIDEDNIIGFDADRNNIVKMLLDESAPSRSVVSIVGQGGLGKTTLAKKVYNSYEVKRAFDSRIWVAISQEFELINVLKKILNELQIYESKHENDTEYFLNKLYQSLKGKKYLLVIDDVWETSFWMNIEKALPDDKNGSRILMTTRIFEVAKEANLACEPYKLQFLNEESSLELFSKKALLNQENHNKYPTDLMDLANQFAAKCGGLPLALVVLGGLLAKKQPTYAAWNKVMQTMNWHANEQKVCLEIIGTSYNDLPFALKLCFMYFAAYPEDYDILVESLVKMWVAEGFIVHQENRTLEDTATSFLEDLVQRSMVQVSKRSLIDDSIWACRIHDLLRDVAIQKAKEENFLSVCLNGDWEQSCGGARRVAVHNQSDCSELMANASSNLRTLLCFNSQLPNCAGYKRLKVLSHYTANGIYNPVEMTRLEGLSQVRYLQLTPMSIKWDKGRFKKLLGNMRFLQTLDISFFAINVEIPNCIWHIKTLRHLLLPYGTFNLGVPPSTDLRNLQTLRGVKTQISWESTTLPNLPNLRELEIEIIEGFPWDLAADFLKTLHKLESLIIKRRDEPTQLVDTSSFPFYRQLTCLEYWSCFFCRGCVMTFEVAMFPIHLTILTFQDCELQQEHLAVLEKLPGLKYFQLGNAYPNRRMKCSAGGFPQLQELVLNYLEELEEWEIEEGAMPLLRELHVNSRSTLLSQVPLGLRHLLSLRSLYWSEWDRRDEDVRADEIRNICKHVPDITIYMGGRRL